VPCECRPGLPSNLCRPRESAAARQLPTTFREAATALIRERFVAQQHSGNAAPFLEAGNNVVGIRDC
jgi:hypothetical protein